LHLFGNHAQPRQVHLRHVPPAIQASLRRFPFLDPTVSHCHGIPHVFAGNWQRVTRTHPSHKHATNPAWKNKLWHPRPVNATAPSSMAQALLFTLSKATGPVLSIFGQPSTEPGSDNLTQRVPHPGFVKKVFLYFITSLLLSSSSPHLAYNSSILICAASSSSDNSRSFTASFITLGS